MFEPKTSQSIKSCISHSILTYVVLPCMDVRCTK